MVLKAQFDSNAPLGRYWVECSTSFKFSVTPGISHILMKKHYAEKTIEQVPPSNMVLNLVAQEIPAAEIQSSEIQALIDNLFSVAYGRQGDAQFPTLVGLAAPQIGVSKRVVIIGLNAAGDGEQPELRAFINPEIIESSDETDEGREGCFSTSRVCGIVRRAKKVTVQAYDRNGNRFKHAFEDFPARVAQHEIDHLNGIRFPDRITDDTKLHWVEEKEFGDYRKNWRNWPVNCSRKKWESIKSGYLL